MKCKKCGANYKTKELSCPYCNTENLIGKIWMHERSAAELEYEKTRKELGKKISTYSVNRILNRTMVIMLLTCILATAALITGTIAWAIISGLFTGPDRRTVAKRIDKLFEEGKYSEFAYEVSVHDGEYPYMQASLMIRDYDKYINYKYRYLKLDDEQRKKDNFSLEYSIREAIAVYKLDYYKYSELHAANRELHEMYVAEIESYFKSILGLSDEDIEFMVKEEYLSNEEMKDIVKKAKEATIGD